MCSKLFRVAREVIRSDLVVDDTCTLFEDVECCFRRGIILRKKIELPLDLKNALQKNQIELKHLPKKFIDQVLFVDIVDKSSEYTMNCVLHVYKCNGIMKCEDKFTYTIQSPSKV